MSAISSGRLEPSGNCADHPDDVGLEGADAVGAWGSFMHQGQITMTPGGTWRRRPCPHRVVCVEQRSCCA